MYFFLNRRQYIDRTYIFIELSNDYLINNKTADIELSVHGALLLKTSSGDANNQKLESQIIASKERGLFCRISPNITEKINVHAGQMNGIL